MAFNSDAFDEKVLSDRLGDLRFLTALKERCAELSQQLEIDLRAHIDDVDKGHDCGISPPEKLKLEAMAQLVTLAAFHCNASHNLTELRNYPCAHTWATDEGALRAAIQIVRDIDVSIPPSTLRNP